MANKAIDKPYLLQTLKDFYNKILSTSFQKKLTQGSGIEITTDVTTGDQTIATEAPFSVVSGMICVTYDTV